MSHTLVQAFVAVPVACSVSMSLVQMRQPFPSQP
jgi:hypothetical protein